MNTCLELFNSPEEEKKQVAQNIANWCDAYSNIVIEAMRFTWRGLSVIWADVQEFDLEYDAKRNNWDFALVDPVVTECFIRRIVIEYDPKSGNFDARFAY